MLQKSSTILGVVLIFSLFNIFLIDIVLIIEFLYNRVNLGQNKREFIV